MVFLHRSSVLGPLSLTQSTQPFYTAVLFLRRAIPYYLFFVTRYFSSPVRISFSSGFFFRRLLFFIHLVCPSAVSRVQNNWSLMSTLYNVVFNPSDTRFDSETFAVRNGAYPPPLFLFWFLRGRYLCRLTRNVSEYFKLRTLSNLWLPTFRCRPWSSFVRKIYRVLCRVRLLISDDVRRNSFRKMCVIRTRFGDAITTIPHSEPFYYFN